mmetsp:Transcript_41166/g.66716  ORF Transcript_41166/g.66716 Transcript_41166/m.66716 type:complete len:172 (+) Transcript_41166:388-903(+)
MLLYRGALLGHYPSSSIALPAVKPRIVRISAFCKLCPWALKTFAVNQNVQNRCQVWVPLPLCPRLLSPHECIGRVCRTPYGILFITANAAPLPHCAKSGLSKQSELPFASLFGTSDYRFLFSVAVDTEHFSACCACSPGPLTAVCALSSPSFSTAFEEGIIQVPHCSKAKL